MTDIYGRLGVSATKEEVHAAIAGLAPPLYPGAFCPILADEDDDRAAVLLHADGAGTKAIVAYLAFRETGDPAAFAGIAIDSAVMNIDDMICVGATDQFLLSNTIGRNAQRIPGSVIKTVIHGYHQFAATLAAHGIRLRLSGGETADVGDLVRTIIVDSTAHARFPRARVVDASRMRPGLAIVALGSAGQASYETDENSGIGSNGLTVARHVLLHPDYARAYPESFAETLDPAEVYRGPYHLADKLPGSGLTVGQALLSPTRTYAPVVKRLLDEQFEDIVALVHCSGGGLTKCLHFGRGIHYWKTNLMPPPPLFQAIAAAGAIPAREMWRVFNNGQRLEVYCRPEAAERVVATAAAFKIAAQVTGETRASPDGQNRLTIRHDGREESY